MPDVMDDERDERLDEALNLLQRPVRKSSSALIPLTAAVLLTGAGALLIYMMTSVASDRATQGQAASSAMATNSPGFELSGSSADPAVKDTPPVREAVIIGTEESR